MADPTREAAYALLTAVFERRRTLEDALNALPAMDARDRSAGHRLAAAVLRLTPDQWLAHQARKHIFYERRPDRKNFYELLKFVDAGLA